MGYPRPTESSREMIWGRSHTNLRWNFGSSMSPVRIRFARLSMRSMLGWGSLGTGAVGPDVGGTVDTYPYRLSSLTIVIGATGYRRPRRILADPNALGGRDRAG